MFRVVPPPIVWSAYNCIYSIWYLSHRYCYLPHQRQVAVTVWQIPDAVDTVVCAPDDGWRYHPKHAEQFPDINKLCKVASCWIYRVRQKYLTILQNRCQWNRWHGEFVLERSSSETKSISVAMERWSVSIGLLLWRCISKTTILS